MTSKDLPPSRGIETSREDLSIPIEQTTLQLTREELSEAPSRLDSTQEQSQLVVSGGVVAVYPWGVGMPQFLWLQTFAQMISHVYPNASIELVGSSLKSRYPRDVDVRITLEDDEFEREVGNIISYSRSPSRWSVLCVAFSLLGKQLTGLQIDCQIHPRSVSSMYENERRRPLGGSV